MSRQAPAPAAGTQQRVAWLNTAAKVLGAGLAFALQVGFARTMTPAAFADLAVILAWLAIGTALCTFSMPLMIVRYAGESLALGRADLARGVVGFALSVTLGCSAAVAALAALLLLSGAIEMPRDLPRSALVGVALLVPGVLLLDLAGLLQALKRVLAAEIIVNVTRPVLALAALGALWLMQAPPFSAPSVLGAYLATTLAVTLVCIIYARIVVPRALLEALPARDYATWIRAAGGFTVVSSLVAVHERIDLVVMPLVASPAEVATYAVAVRFAQTVSIAGAAALAVMVPHLVEHLADVRAGRTGAAQAVVNGAARTLLYISLLALAGFAALGPWLLDLFGPHYAGAYVPLLVLVAGQALTALFGPALLVATLAGETRSAVVCLLIGIAVNAVSNVLAVPVFGATGAALATVGAGLTTAFLAARQVRRRLGFRTSLVGTRASTTPRL